MLQSKTSRVRDPIKRMNFFFSLPNPSSRALEFTHSITEMIPRNRKIMFLGSKARPVSRTDNLTAICEPTV
jgi:hypothetical protein